VQSLDAPIVSKISIIALVVVTLLCFRMVLALASRLGMFSLHSRHVFPVRSWAATDVTYPILFNVKYVKIVWS
jgi:K+-sensing histidine kinase KdpD